MPLSRSANSTPKSLWAYANTRPSGEKAVTVETEVEGLVHQHDMPVALLGMSFLNRVEMQRDGDHWLLRATCTPGEPGHHRAGTVAVTFEM